MKLIALVKISNESEIIESFIRYNFNIVDKMLIVSSCCVDNTNTIIRHLISEGYDITLIEDPYIGFEERYIDSKHLKMIAEADDTDMVIPLDADEFIAGEGNPRELIENLSLDKIYIINWKNYAIRESDDFTEPFIPKRLTYVKQNYDGNNVTKVMIPTRLILEHEIIMTAGRHSVSGNEIEEESLLNLWIAHYPATSKDQYIKMLYEGSIKGIIRTTQGNNEGYHRYMQVNQIQKGADVYKVANDYGFGFSEKAELKMIRDPLNLSFLTPASLEMKYTELSKIDLITGLLSIGQLMALKAYKLETEKQMDSNKKNILVFGIGNEEKGLFNGIPIGTVNIWAYIDNDPSKQLRMYNQRLVIRPEYVRFFKYDKIIISSTKYYEEMRKQLIEVGVPKEKIGSVKFVFDTLQDIREGKTDG